MRFKEKVVIVTGGAQGIGMAITRSFAREGAKVVIADIDQEAGKENELYMRENGGECIYVQVDVASEESVKNMVQEAVSHYGGVNILINNAGIGGNKSIYERSMEEWDRILGINLRGPFMCTKYCAPYIKKNGGGAIINIASTRALMSEPNTEPYSASKGGILALTHSLAVSLGPDKIRVNAISPGWIDVTGWKKQSKREQVQLTERDHLQHPVGRVGNPEDIAAACLFLCSEEAGFITGTNLVIDGGMTIKMIYEE
ncbi:MAG: hypothetical protein PWR27_237 [Petroclostridium sp.]|jgi:hypothetical protein|nr:hypothetical protein [Petroclostridium sp.]